MAMRGLEDKLSEQKLWIVIMLVLVALGSSFRHIDSLSNFLLTLGGHAFFGQALYCYLSGRIIVVGAAIGVHAPLVERRLAAIFATSGFVLMFFYA